MRALLASAVMLATGAAAVPTPRVPEEVATTRAALREALLERRAAEARSLALERRAGSTRDAAGRAATQAAALAARVQQAEAGIAAADARARLVGREQAVLREALGQREKPVVRLTAALEQLSRRPLVLAVLRPGSIDDVIHLRAVLSSAVPQVRARTAGLRAQLVRMRQLRDEARQAAQILRAEQGALTQRRTELAALETRLRLAARAAGGEAARESERALALAENTRDLDALLAELDRAGSVRARLAALPGPRLRPANPALAAASAPPPEPSAIVTGAPAPYQLPVTGRTVAGFGGDSRGVTLAPQPGALVVAPGAGRIAFAGPYRGYGRIVIIEHAAGWTTLVTGLARVDATVGAQVVGGAPLGIAPQVRPAITLELRQRGVAVNPLPLVG